MVISITFLKAANFLSQSQDGTFKLTLEFSEEYPNKPPVVKFLSKVVKLIQIHVLKETIRSQVPLVLENLLSF